MRTIPRPILGALLAALLTAAACDRARGGEAEAAAEAHTPAAHHHHASAPPPAPGTPTDHSVYNLESAWYDQHGAARPLGSLAGRVQVVAMVYTHCAHTCPRILMDMKRLEGELGTEAAERVGFVLVSIDPERDTPERLRHFAESVRLDPARWTLLSAPDDSVLELAAVLGVRYRRDGETEFSHSNVITVLDADGEIAHRQLGLGEDPAPTLRAIRGLLGS
jgi:protein SCO1